MLRKLYYLLICFGGLLFFVLLSTCGSDTNQNAEAAGAEQKAVEENGVLELYTNLNDPVHQKLYDAYSKAQGVKVNLYTEPAKAIVDQLVGEGQNSTADIVLLDDIAFLFQLKANEMSRVLISNKIEVMQKDPEGYWFAVAQYTQGLVYAKDRVEPSSINTLENLSQQEYKIQKPDKESVYMRSLFGHMIANKGYNKINEACIALADNFVETDNFMNSITNGTIDLAFISGKDYMEAIEAQPELAEKIAYQPLSYETGEQLINATGLIFGRYSKNLANAIRFIEFCTGEEGQKILMEKGGLYPVAEKVEASKATQDMGTFTPDGLDLESLGLQQGQAAKLMREW